MLHQGLKVPSGNFFRNKEEYATFKRFSFPFGYKCLRICGHCMIYGASLKIVRSRDQVWDLEPIPVILDGQQTLGPCGFHNPFPAPLDSASRSFFLRSSSVGSLLCSLILAHPFLNNSDPTSSPPISAVPKSRGMSSLGGKECVEVNDISFPTASARRKSRDSNAQGYKKIRLCKYMKIRRLNLIFSRRRAHSWSGYIC